MQQPSQMKKKTQSLCANHHSVETAEPRFGTAIRPVSAIVRPWKHPLVLRHAWKPTPFGAASKQAKVSGRCARAIEKEGKRQMLPTPFGAASSHARLSPYRKKAKQCGSDMQCGSDTPAGLLILFICQAGAGLGPLSRALHPCQISFACAISADCA